MQLQLKEDTIIVRGPGLANYIFSRVGGGKSNLGSKGSPLDLWGGGGGERFSKPLSYWERFIRKESFFRHILSIIYLLSRGKNLDGLDILNNNTAKRMIDLYIFTLIAVPGDKRQVELKAFIILFSMYLHICKTSLVTTIPISIIDYQWLRHYTCSGFCKTSYHLLISLPPTNLANTLKIHTGEKKIDFQSRMWCQYTCYFLANGSTNPVVFQPKTFPIPKNFSSLGFAVLEELWNKQTDSLTH